MSLTVFSPADPSNYILDFLVLKYTCFWEDRIMWQKSKWNKMRCSEGFYSFLIIQWGLYSASQRGITTYRKQKYMFIPPCYFQMLPLRAMQFLLANLWLLPKTELSSKDNQYLLKTLYKWSASCQMLSFRIPNSQLHEVYVIIPLLQRKQLRSLKAVWLLGKYHYQGSGIKHHFFPILNSFPQMKS